MDKTMQDIDSQETQEWIDSLEAVIEAEGVERAHFLLEELIATARQNGANLPYSANTAYINTIPPHLEQHTPGNRTIESRLRSYIRWNAAAMVVRANRESPELGGHIATFASAATLYDVGMNHFWHAPSPQHGGDLLYFQGHAAPGMYARSFLEGRFTEAELDKFRQEVDGGGLSSYPHPWLMPDYWQFPTVSMGLGPIKSIYQARFMKYLQDRKLAETANRKVWAFVGDGETDEPETLGAISLGGREKLDNLIWVINCNLQRLDGPVRGNGKIVQELEAVFRGAGWNVIKVLWGSYWDPLLAMDKDGLLKQRMMEAVDGEYQNYKSKDGKYVRENFFGKYPELKEMVAKMSDADIWRLNRGGHDPHKVYAAYHAAVNHTGQPTVILAHTVKGYGMGAAGEGQNRTHSQKKLSGEEMIAYKNRFNIPLSDDDAAAAKYYRPDPNGEEMQYMLERRKALGGFLPQRQTHATPLKVPDLSIFQSLLESTGDREMSTTMVFVRLLTLLARDKNMGRNVVPIVPDEARTFGMEGMFRQLGIYSSVGQLYEPQDKNQVMFYKEDKSGQILEEGINEAGAFSSWIAAATAYSTHGINMVPFYIYYSMFGFQRVGDLAWAAGDCRARGFLIGGTAGRTTLAGEGLQHQDGHSLIQAGLIPNCLSYDPTFSYELAVIVQNGLKRMYQDQEDVFYYITAMNENYTHPAMPAGCEEGIVKGMYLFSGGGKKRKKVQLLGSGAILREVIAAAEMLDKEWGVDANVWSVTSFNEIAREARDIDRWNMLHPLEDAKVPYVTQVMKGQRGPAIAATDYIRQYADQIRAWLPMSYTVLGTDGFGRSDTRAQLRKHFEVNRHYIVIAALKALVDEKSLPAADLVKAMEKYGINPEKPNPRLAEGGHVMAIQEIFVPDIGSFKDVEVIEVLVSVGDTIAVEDSLITIESDKASMEIPSSVSGVVKELKVKVGDRVSEGSLMLVVDVAESGAVASVAAPAVAPTVTPTPIAAPTTKPEPRPQPVQSPTAAVQADLKNVDFSKAYATPSVRKFARELGVDLNKVKGSGRKQRITQEDVKGYVKDLMSLGGVPGKAASGGNTLGVAPMPDIDFSQWGEIETVALSRINKLTGEFLHRNWVHIPHVTQFDQADITDLEAFRKQLNEENAKSGMKITPLVFIMKAVVAGLKAYPRFNASLDAKGENLIRKHYYHVGVAVDTPDGLVVPVIRDVDKKSIMQLSEELKEVSAKARNKKLKPADMQGGCFSISSLGGIGGTKFTPIVNAPEVAILGVSKSEMQPVWNGKEFIPRLMLPLSLSYDHRVIDGADGARFTTYLAKMLGDIRRLLV